MTQQSNTDTTDREIVLTRLLNAPRELVFEAFTDPAHLINWWGPDGFTNTFANYDLRPGGQWNFIMHGPDGVDYPNQVIFSEVDPPSYLSYTHGSGLPDDPDTFSVTITFEAQQGKTKLTMRSVFNSAEVRDMLIEQVNAIEAGNQTINHLEAELVKMFNDPNLIIKTARVFDAPPSLVYKAWSAPEHLAVWFGPAGFTNTFHHFDFVEGGKWLFTMHGPTGANYPNESHFVKLVQDSEIIYDHISAPKFRIHVLLEPVGDKTKMHFSMHFNNVATCNAVKKVVLIANEENMDRLAAELLNIK